MSGRTTHSSTKPPGIILAGGGTAGHINPLLAVADELRSRNPDRKITVLGTSEGLESDLVPARGYDLVTLPKAPLPRRPSLQFFALPSRLRTAINRAGAAIEAIDAAVVVGFGGYVSTPAYIAARRRQIPIVIQEQNLKPGLANRLGARWANASAVAFPGTKLPRAVFTGLPLRTEIAELITRRGDSNYRNEIAQRLGLDPNLPTLVVTGGSLGAQRLNETISEIAGQLTNGAQVIHLTGKGKSAPVLAQLEKTLDADGLSRYHVHQYLSDIHEVYAVADLVVCRAGAGTVCELAALGIPAIYVPLPIGNGEQAKNVAALIEAGGGVLVADGDFTAQWALNNLVPLIGNSARLADLGVAAASVGVPGAAVAVADLIEAAIPTSPQIQDVAL